MSELTDKFEQTLDAIAHDKAFAGVEIVQHRANHRRGMVNISVTIDKDGGVDVATCERIAARINDSLESFETAYSLEVESAGLDRPRRRPKDYQSFAGRPVRVGTRWLTNGGK